MGWNTFPLISGVLALQTIGTGTILKVSLRSSLVFDSEPVRNFHPVRGWAEPVRNHPVGGPNNH